MINSTDVWNKVWYMHHEHQSLTQPIRRRHPECMIRLLNNMARDTFEVWGRAVGRLSQREYRVALLQNSYVWDHLEVFIKNTQHKHVLARDTSCDTSAHSFFSTRWVRNNISVLSKVCHITIHEYPTHRHHLVTIIYRIYPSYHGYKACRAVGTIPWDTSWYY